jgi:Peptidase family M28
VILRGLLSKSGNKLLFLSSRSTRGAIGRIIRAKDILWDARVPKREATPKIGARLQEVKRTRLADCKLKSLEDALREHVHALAVDIGPRTPSSPNSLVRAANYIHSVFEDSGLSVKEQDYQYYDQRVTNVLATVPATAEASTYYVIGAHYDTVPSTPGADDNASAVAVMLELALRLRQAKLNAPILFAAFTLEEPPAHLTGHQGSRIFVRGCRSKGDVVLGAIILEMVGYTSPRQRYPFVPRWPGYPAQGNFIGIIGNWRSRNFGGSVLTGFRKNRDLPVESLFLPFDGRILPETRLSDHASFWDVGLPALMVTDTAFFRNPNYHLLGDTIDTLDFTFMAQVVKSLEFALLELPALPPPEGSEKWFAR